MICSPHSLLVRFSFVYFSDSCSLTALVGSAISWDGYFNAQIENEVFSSVIDLVLNCGCFVYIGAWLPFTQFNSPELGITPWRLVVLFIAILFLRRIPVLLLLYRWVPEIEDWREALFSGHFGKFNLNILRSLLILFSFRSSELRIMFASSLC